MDKDKPDAWKVQEPWSMQGKGRNLRRAKADNRYIESIQFVPHTPGSTLRNNLTKMEQKLGFKTRFRYCEEMGRSIRELLVRKDPNPEHCSQTNCLPCKSRVGA